MSLDTLEIETGPSPTHCVIVLHGLGDSGEGFAPIAEELDLSPLGAVRFVLPHAPERPVTINGGYVMRAWYDILGTDLAKREDEAGLRQSMASVQALITRERERGLPASRIVLMGFSQGCAMVLLAGPERGHGDDVASSCGHAHQGRIGRRGKYDDAVGAPRPAPAGAGRCHHFRHAAPKVEPHRGITLQSGSV